MPRPKISEICTIEGCEVNAKGFGWCAYHYQKFYKTHPNYKPRSDYNNRRKHPLYIIWWQRKSNNLLCEKWLDFLKFIEDVGEKPSKNHFLVRIRNNLFGPDNFQWQENLRRREGETKKEWHARKWAARQAANPSMERGRHYKRKYGITIEEYEIKLKEQNFVCAICEQKEISFDAKVGTIRRLAIDHCHNSLKIRGLLCWRCNGTIGKVEDNVELMQKMIEYIRKHNHGS